MYEGDPFEGSDPKYEHPLYNFEVRSLRSQWNEAS